MINFWSVSFFLVFLLSEKPANFLVFFNQVLDFSDDEKEREAKQKKKKPQSQARKKVRSETLPSSE